MVARDGGYTELAKTYVRLVRSYSPNAGAALEKLYPYGASVVYIGALTVLKFNTDMATCGEPPERSIYLREVNFTPEAVLLLERALECLLLDQSMGNVKSRRQ